ncbi:MAG: TonB-dependent receptor [Sphingopyxis sp.]|nr:TonB-dependent receptor [Sphingopyxis sp.]
MLSALFLQSLSAPPVTIPPAPPVSATAAASSAGDDGDDDGGDNVIIVTALPRPVGDEAYGAGVVERDAIAASAANRIEDVLARVPGFQQFRRSDSRSANPSAQGVTLRALGGNAASRTLVLLDGVPIADAFFGSVPFTALPTDSIDSIAITRGSGVGPFGAGALAGVVEMTSRLSAAPADIGNLTGGSIAMGSRGAREAALAFALPLGSGRLLAEARHDSGDGFFTTPADQRSAASVAARYRAQQVALSAAIDAGAGATLFPRLAAYRDARTLRFAGADSRSEGIDASLRLIRPATSRGAWGVEGIAWVQARDFSNIVVSATSFRPTLNQRATPSMGWGSKIELRPPVDSARRTLRFGVDMRGASGEAIEDVLAANGARTLTRRSGGSVINLGAFGEVGQAIGPVTLTGGVRVDHWRLHDGRLREDSASGASLLDQRLPSRRGTITSGRAALSWTVADGLVLRGAFYTGFRLPTLNELYRGFTLFPVTTRANAALQPERLTGWETGATWVPLAGTTLAITAFDNRVADAIANVTIATNLRQRRNIARIRSRGVEASLETRLGAVTLSAGAAYSDARLRPASDDGAAQPLNGLRPAQSPRWSGSAELRWDSAWGVTGAVGVRHIGAQFEDDRAIDRLPPATTADAVVRWTMGPTLSGAFRVENMFDARIITRNAAGSIDLGQPRTLWFELRLAGLRGAR